MERALGTAILLLALPGGALAVLGSQDLEPGLIGRDDVIFFEDFEASSWYGHWGRGSSPENCSRATTPVFDGSGALRVHAPGGSHYGSDFEFDFTDRGLAEPEELYFRYYVYASAGWHNPGDSGSMGKMPGFAGTYGVAGWGGRRADGYNGWSARMHQTDFTSTFGIGYYVYHADMGSWGSIWEWEIGNRGRITREAWHCVEGYCRLNSISGGTGNYDGVLRGWIDGELAFDRSNVRFRHVDSLKIERIWFNVYIGGSQTAPHDMDLYFDNVVIAREPIGTIVTTPDTVPPSVSITVPTSTGSYQTTNNSVNLEGTATDDLAVTQVRWHNALLGFGGEATRSAGTWRADYVMLGMGTNVITVTAYDRGDNADTDTITVVRFLAGTPPPATNDDPIDEPDPPPGNDSLPVSEDAPSASEAGVYGLILPEGEAPRVYFSLEGEPVDEVTVRLFSPLGEPVAVWEDAIVTARDNGTFAAELPDLSVGTGTYVAEIVAGDRRTTGPVIVIKGT